LKFFDRPPLSIVSGSATVSKPSKQENKHSDQTVLLVRHIPFWQLSQHVMFFRIPEAGGGLCGCQVGPAQLFPLVSQANHRVPIIVSPHEMADKDDMMRMPLHCCCTSAGVDQCYANRALHSTLLSCTVGTGVKPSVQHGI
jgi:hypothetical protein